MAYILPAAKCDLNISNAEQGFINSVMFMGTIFTANIWGFVADTWGRKNVIQLCLATVFIFSTLSSFSYSTGMLMVARIFIGLWCVVNNIINRN